MLYLSMPKVKECLAKTFGFLKSNFLIILLGVIASLTMVYSGLVFKYQLGTEYRGIERMVSDDEIYYLARGQDVIDGHYLLGNPYVYELKDTPTLQFFLPDFIVAKSLSWTGLNITEIFFVYDIVLPFILTILTYLSLFYLTKSKFWSIGGVVFLVFGLFFYFFSRPISPQFNFLFYLSLFLFLLKYINSKGKDKLYFYLSLINFGLLFYLYTYYWTFYFIVLSISATAFLIQKEKTIGLGLFYILSGGTLIGSVYFYNTWKAMKLPEYWDTLTRMGMIYSHLPSGLAIVITGSLILFGHLILLRKRRVLGLLDIFIISGVLSGMIAVNQHVITGKNLAFTVHYFLPATYWFVFALIYLFSQISNLSKFLKLAILVVSYVVVFVISSAYYQITTNLYHYYSRASKISEYEVYTQNYAPILDWLNKNTEKDEVVLANEEISRHVSVYTHDNVFYSELSSLHFMTDEEVLKRFFLNHYFTNVDKDYVIHNFTSLYGKRYTDMYLHNSQINKLRSLFGLDKIEMEFYPEEIVNNTLKLFSNMRKEKYTDLISEYKVDYFIWDKNKNPEWNLDKYKFLKKEYAVNNIEIYRFVKI